MLAGRLVIKRFIKRRADASNLAGRRARLQRNVRAILDARCKNGDEETRGMNFLNFRCGRKLSNGYRVASKRPY